MRADDNTPKMTANADNYQQYATIDDDHFCF
jgi:hypothetical protein